MMQTAHAATSGSAIDPAGLRLLAQSLDREGRADDALIVLKHLAALRPRDIDTLRPLAKLLSAQGRTLEAVETLSEMKSATTDWNALLADIEGQMPSALQDFNTHLAAGEIEMAEEYVSALVNLVPRNKALLNAALSCNLALGRRTKAAKYAQALLTIDAAHEGARALLAETTKPSVEGEQRVASALSTNSDAHPLLRLRDIHDAASAILCRPVDAQGIAQVAELLESAGQLSIGAPAGSEWEGWEKHYRLMLDAFDLASLKAPVPDPVREPNIALMTAAGERLNWRELRAMATKLGAKAVFLAAADEAYINLYARRYIKSVLDHCDVPCLVILHVIGGASRLTAVTKSIGIKDKRLILTVDRFDAETVTTQCFDTPPKGRIAKPVAHFQSIRFLRLGQFLEKLKRPIFVSDIDVLLQRGVADLIECHAGADVVFNENTASQNAGSRLTANLMLVNPTQNASLTLRYLRAYLERSLAKPEVTRWIDQVGLMLARHYLQLNAANPRIGYFDTASDINNVMYRSWQENPFRFLSLYHGFDMSSLEPELNVAAKRKKPKLAVKRQKRRAKKR
jgi:tetratricopeptide (TPR) repeat protein